jgi:hypothetical protein
VPRRSDLRACSFGEARRGSTPAHLIYEKIRYLRSRCFDWQLFVYLLHICAAGQAVSEYNEHVLDAHILKVIDPVALTGLRPLPI